MTSGPGDDDEPAAARRRACPSRLETTLSHSRALAGHAAYDACRSTGGLTNCQLQGDDPATQRSSVRLSSSRRRPARHRPRRGARSTRCGARGRRRAGGHRLPAATTTSWCSRWIEGRTLSRDDLRATRRARPRVARRAARCTQGRGSPADFDMFAVQRRYLAIVQERGFRLPDDYLDLLPPADADRGRARRATQDRPVPCNNDLLAANFIDDGERLWVIDYEYGGNNDACFELGNIWQRVRASTRATSAALVDAYCGRHLSPPGGPRPPAGRCSRATAGRCGPRSRPRSARSTSTSGPGGCRSTTKPGAELAGPGFDRPPC